MFSELRLPTVYFAQISGFKNAHVMREGKLDV